MRTPLVIRIFQKDQLKEVKQFEQDQIIFGSGEDVLLKLDDPSVSAIHGLIEVRESGYYVADLGSVGGTFKNGAAVLDVAVSSGDKISVGSFVLQIFVGAPQAKQAPTSPTTNVSAPARPATQEAHGTGKPTVPTPDKLPVKKAPVLPTSDVKKTSAANFRRKKRGQKTFAPPSEITDLRRTLTQSKGPVVEVIVAWKERILDVHRFATTVTVSLGSAAGCDIRVPSVFLAGKIGFMEIGKSCRVFSHPSMKAEIISSGVSMDQDEILRKGKGERLGAGISIRLDQGDVACFTLGGGEIEIFVRYSPLMRSPILAGLDFSAGEITSLAISVILVSLFAVYVQVYTPALEEEEKPEEPTRVAKFVYNVRKEKLDLQDESQQDKVAETVKEVKKVEKQTDVKLDNKKSTQTSAGKANEIRPKPKVDRPKKFTSMKSGGAVKISTTESANAQSRDVTKMSGLLGAFNAGGNRAKLDQTYAGAEGILGVADKATGTTGQSQDRAGNDLGSIVKDTGPGGKGTATQGIQGIGTHGKSSGQGDYGDLGPGSKGQVSIDASGVEAAFTAGIDREGVRRVIRKILSQIKSCYERQLRQKAGLEGKVIIQFEIEVQGRVKIAKTKSTTLNNSSVESCVAGRIKEQRFPEPPVGQIAVVDFPFVFGAQK